MNPFFWLIRKELEVVHEFIADEAAVAGDDAAVLAEMLLKAHYHSNSLSVGQSFFYSSIKRRIIMLTSSKKVSYSYARRLLILPVAIGVLVLLSFTIKDSLSDIPNSQMDQASISASMRDTVPAQYRDPKTGKIKGSFRIDIDGDMASFKDIKSKKELFKLPLNELAGPANKKVSVEGSPLYTEKKITFISTDSMPVGTTFIGTADAIRLRGGSDGSKPPRVIIDGKEISPADLDKIDPSAIKAIVLHAVNGTLVSGTNLYTKTVTDPNSPNGKKILTIKVDSVMFDGKANVAVPTQGNVSNIHISADTLTFKTVTDNKTNSNVSATIVRVSDDKVVEKTKTDPNEPITVTGYKKNSNASTITIRTTDDKVVEETKKDPKTLTVTTTDKDGKKTITYVQPDTILWVQGKKVSEVKKISKEGKNQSIYFQQSGKASESLPNNLLTYVDGREVTLEEVNKVNPMDIKSINVLKGETAVTKYGEKGKNGVIEITTKKN
jgi:TonB-dependent SusC/RagA subfamily outer membrane receptor